MNITIQHFYSDELIEKDTKLTERSKSVVAIKLPPNE